MEKYLSPDHAYGFVQQSLLYEDLMKLVKTNEAFYSVDHPHPLGSFRKFRVFTYRLASYSDFMLPGALEARGIMYEIGITSEGEEFMVSLVSRPPAKFFNIGENPLTLELDYSKVTMSMVKEDGSLISSYRYYAGQNDVIMQRLGMKSKTSISSEQAVAALAYVKANASLEQGILFLEQRGYTVNFEWCAPNNRIVVGYEEPKLIVLNARNRFTGQYLDRTALEETFPDHVVPYGEMIRNEQDIERLKAHTGYEGVILQFEQGYKVDFVKFKNDWYLHRHRTKDSVNNANDLFDCVLNEGSDDLKTLFHADPLAMKLITDMEALVIPLYNQLVTACEAFYNENKELDRKSFAIKGQTTKLFEDDNLLNKIAFGPLMCLYKGEVPDYKALMSKNKRLWTKQDA